MNKEVISMKEKFEKTKELWKDNKDHPERYKTDQPSLFDIHESQLNVDPIPVEELNEKVKDEKDKKGSKHTSSSEKD